MKIRIVKAKDNEYWYVDKIGEVFETTGREYGSDISVRHDGEDYTYYVGLEDCEEVIEHNSQLYRKVDRPVREGDTVLITKVNYGEVNEVRTITEVDEHLSLLTIDRHIDGEEYLEINERYCDEYGVIEPIEQPVQPSAPSYAEVSELLHEAAETAEQRQRLDKVREGFIESAIKASFAKVAEINGAALQRLADSDKEDIVTHNGKQYRKVKRKAVVGDLVVVEFDGTERFKDGEIVKPFKVGEGGIIYVKHPQGKNEGGAALYIEEYRILEPIEQSGHTEIDLIANLAQEVTELKRQLTDAQTDIADLEDRLDENEKDTEELIGRINDVSDAVVPVDVIEKVIAELRELEGHAEKLCDHYEDNGIKELAQFHDGKSHAFLDAQKLLKEALRNG